MGEYQLAFRSMPYIGFAHRYDTDQYSLSQTSTPRRIELTYILRGTGNIRYPDQKTETIHVPCDSVIFTIYDRPVTFFATDFHQHATVELWADFEHVETGGLLLPHVLTFGTPDNPVRPLLDQLVLHFTLEPESTLLQAMIWELLGKISQLYQADKQKETISGQSWYVKRAQQFIISNIASPMRVTDVADHLGISASYLSHLFTDIQGQTVMEYINTVRIRRVEELVLTYGSDIREAGAQVGLADPNYISRLFRQIRGCSISELRKARITDRR